MKSLTKKLAAIAMAIGIAAPVGMALADEGSKDYKDGRYDRADYRDDGEYRKTSSDDRFYRTEDGRFYRGDDGRMYFDDSEDRS